MCSGEAFKAISRVQAMQAWGPLLCLEGAHVGRGDVPQDWAASLGALPCPSVLCLVPCCCALSLVAVPCPSLLCHVPHHHAVSLATVPCPSVLCHVRCCHAVSLTTMSCPLPPQSATPASAAVLTVQLENEAQAPEQPPHQLTCLQRALMSITTTRRARGASANNGGWRAEGVSWGQLQLSFGV